MNTKLSQVGLQAWDDTAVVSFDQQRWTDLISLRFLADAYNVHIMDQSGSEKPSWPTP
ncbi:MAG: hypothetical protein ACJ74F_23375 [Mycobacterium sp.]|uniref:hypothetical protein n=1 Tax=Mycobacterium sp. TaxID=1785 RepID=UPI00389A47E0